MRVSQRKQRDCCGFSIAGVVPDRRRGGFRYPAASVLPASASRSPAFCFPAERAPRTIVAEMVTCPIAYDQFGAPSDGVLLCEVPLVNGSVDIEWEVTSRNVQAGELSVEFVAVTTYEGVPEGLSLPQACSVWGSFGPTPPDFTASAAASASSSLPIPRFIASTTPALRFQVLE